MTHYTIQKQSGLQWVSAFGLKDKSYIEANSDTEAEKVFKERLAKCRSKFRLISWAGFGYGVKPNVVSILN